MIAPRPAFRFSLRTMLIVVALVSCWLGYCLNWIRQRHDFLGHSAVHATPGSISLYNPDAPVWVFLSSAQQPVPAPFWLRVLGERGVAAVDVMDAKHSESLDVAARLFPEAQIGMPADVWDELHKRREQ